MAEKGNGTPPKRGFKRPLDPMDRLSEVLFGLIMVLTFTGSMSAAESGRAEIRAMLIGAVGCNLAWGIIDAIMYLMACLAERGQRAQTLLTVRGATTPEEGRSAIEDALPPALAGAISEGELENLRMHINRLPEPSKRAHLQAEDWFGALAVFVLVFLSTVPVILPFIFMGDAMAALRVSNVIAVSMMFLTGYAFGRLAGWRPLLVGISMVALGAALVSITIAMGG